MTHFRLHNRGATHYRAGPCFLSGAAAHIHSPAGAQGMNTGIQDALSLGWKLALVCGGAAPEEPYRRSPASTVGARPPRRGPQAGDRLPDRPHGLQSRCAGPGYHLLLTGPPHLWPNERIAPVPRGRDDLVDVPI